MNDHVGDVAHNAGSDRETLNLNNLDLDEDGAKCDYDDGMQLKKILILIIKILNFFPRFARGDKFVKVYFGKCLIQTNLQKGSVHSSTF